MGNSWAVKKSEKRNRGEIPFIWSRVGDPSDAFLRLYSRIFTDIFEGRDTPPLERDDHEIGGSNKNNRQGSPIRVPKTGEGTD